MTRKFLLFISSVIFLAGNIFGQVVYVDNSETQFNSGSHNSTYVSGTGPSAAVSLDYYGRAAGLSVPDTAEWFNPEWKYRRPLTVDSSNPLALSNYTVLLTLDTQALVAAGRMNSDGADIRFNTPAGTITLPYYIESGMNTSATKIWVKLPSIVTGTNTVYMYYGNPSASAASSMAATFTLGDNFTAANGSAPNAATWSATESHAPVTGSLRDIQSDSLRLLFGSPTGLNHFGLRSTLSYSFAAGRSYKAYLNARTAGSDSASSFTLCPYIFTNSYDKDKWLRFSINHSAAGAAYTLVRNDFGTKTALVAATSLSAGYHGVEFLISSSTFKVLLDGTQIYSAANNLPFNSPYVYLEASSSASSLDEFLFDNISVAPYAPPVPAYGSTAAEQGRRYAAGSFVSQAKDSGSAGSRYLSADWAAISPSTTSVTLEMRANDSDVELSTFAAVSKGGDPNIAGRYAQYRLNFSSLDPRYTTSVSSVAFSYGSPPLAPGSPAGQALSASSIKWTWTDTSSGQYQEEGFKVLDATGALRGTALSGGTEWTETGLNTNTRYSRQILGYNASGDGLVSLISKYTLPAAPSVGCDKSTGTWLSGTLNCTNLAGFGNNGVTYYSYEWNQQPTKTWTGSEPHWSSSSLIKSDFTTGNWYLHVKSYNGDNVAVAGDMTYGPYWYDKNVPSVTGFSPSSNPWTNTGLSAQASLSDTGGSQLWRVRYRWTTTSDRPATGWQAYDYAISGTANASSNFTIASAGQWYLHIEVDDTAGNTGYSYAGPFKIDLTNPSGSIAINGGDIYTASRNVILNLTYSDSESGVKTLQYHNTALPDSNPELPQATSTWSLIPGDGSKQVYVKITDNAGNIYQTADAITLDSRTSLLGGSVGGTASGVMGEPPETFNPQGSISWTPTGASLQGKTLSFYFNGSTKTAVTDILGSASASFEVPAASGTYTYNVSFSTDGTYSASSTTGTLTASRRDTTVITEDVNATSNNPFIAKATLKNLYTANLISGATISFYFEGSTLTARTNGVGVATVTFTAPVPAGYYDYTATFAGNTVYGPTSATSRIGVNRNVTTLVLTPASGMASSDFLPQATLLDGVTPVQGATISFYFQGSTQTALTNASGVAAYNSFTVPASSGTYPFSAGFDGDTTYAASAGNATLTVTPRPLSLAGEMAQGYINASFQARAVLYDGISAQPVAGKSIVFVFEGSSAAVNTDSAGVSTAVFNSGALARASTCYYYFSGDAGYAFADSTKTVTINRRPVAVAASDISVLLNSSFTATSQLKDTAFSPVGIPGKTITFVFGESSRTAVTDALGVASATFQGGLSTGTYEFYAYFAQDSVYVAGNDTGTVTMDKRPSVVSAYPKFLFAFDNIQPVADLKDGINGELISSQTISFNYNGVFQSTTTGSSGTSLGRAYGVYPGTGVAGNYSYSATFPGNSLYSGNSSTASLSVSQRPVNLSAFPNTAIWGSSFTATAEFRDGSNNLLVSGKTLRLAFSTAAANSVTAAGVASSSFTAPASTGTFSWFANFSGDQAYSAASSTGTISIIRRSATLTPISTTKNVWDNIFLSATFTDDSIPLVSKQLSFNFQGSTKTATTNASGVATTVAFSSISAPGTYTYSVSFTGDTNYSAQSGSSTVTIIARPSTINLGPISAIANSTVTLSATLLDTYWGTPITGKSVTFSLQGATFTVSALTNTSGIATAKYVASGGTGNYNYSATFAGNTNYSGTSNSNTVTVTVRPSVLEMADYYPPASSTFTVSAVLKDYDTGAVIASKTLSFLFLGVTRTALTNGLGSGATSYVALNNTLSYPISVSFAGDPLYSAASITKTVYPGKRNTSLQTSDILTAVAKDSFTVTARLSDYDLGTYLPGKTITFSFSGSSYTLTGVTDSTGIVSANFTAPLSTGSYTYTATFSGTSLYNGTLNTASVLVNRRDLTIEPGDLTGVPATSTFTISALVHDSTITLSGKTLSFVFYSTKAAATNGIGIASTTFPAPVSTGTYSYAVSYPGDALYKPGLAYGNLSVILKPTVLEVLDVPDAVVGLNFTGTAKLRDIEQSNALVLAPKPITFVFSTSTINSVTAIGVATATLTAPLIIGDYTYTATFPGDGTYGPSQSTGTVTVKRRPVIFSVDVPAGEPYTLSTFTVKGTLVDGKTGEALANQTINIYFKVANATHTIQTDAVGIATTTFYSGTSSGSYVYSGTFDGDSSYDASEINEQTVKTVKINQRPTSIQPFLADGQLMTWGVYTFNNFNTTVVMQDNLDSNSGIPGLTVSFMVQGSTLTGVSAANGQATSSSPFPYIVDSGIYPAEVWFAGNQTYAPSVLHGGQPSQIPLEGFVREYASPANIAMDSIQETYPDADTVLTGVAHDGYLGDRAAARLHLKGTQVRYRIATAPCNPYPTNCPYGTLGPASWATVNDSYIATATVHSPTEIGDYPIERWFATTSSFYYWEVSEDRRVLRVGLRPTDIDVATAEPLEVGANMPITLKVKLKSTSQGDIGVVGKTVVITFNGGTPQNVTTVTGGIAQYTFAGLPVGNYTYTATFAGDSAYNSAELSPVGNVSVIKNTTFLVGTPVTNVPAGNDFTAKATLNVLVGTAQVPAPGRTIDFTFPGNASSSSITNAQGIAQVTFTSPQVPGPYDFTATLTENASDLGAVIHDPEDNVQVVKRRTSLASVSVNPVYIQDNFTSTATLTDLDAPPNLASLIGQTINFTLHRGGAEGDIAGGNPTLASPLGQATKIFLSPAESGSKSYTSAFAGDTLYAAVTAADAGVNVLKRTTILASASEPTTQTNTIFTATATLKDNTPTLGAPIPMGPGLHVPVKFVYNGVTTYATTDDSGVAMATFTAQAEANNYSCNITFEGNTTYAPSNITLPIHVIKRTTHVTGVAILHQPAGAYFTAQATLTDDISASGIQYATITFVFVGGGTFNDSGITDFAGVTSALFTAPLSTGTYNYTACYPGDATYEGSCDNSNDVTVDVASTTLSVPDGTVTVNNIYFATATLKGKESGIGVADKTISFTYDGVLKGQPSTDDDGIAIQSFTPLSTGTYRLDVAFAGDSAFFASAGSATITVTRRISGIEMLNINSEVDAIFIATVTLRDLTSVPSTLLAGKTIDIFFDGTHHYPVTNALGIATAAFTSPGATGNPPITATFLGDGLYEPGNITANVFVAKHDTQLTIADGPAKALDLFIATATLRMNGIPVAGKTIQFTYKGSVLSDDTDGNGQAFVQYNAGPSSGPWRVDGAFDGSADTAYESSSGSGTITVLRRDCLVIPENVTVETFGIFNATVTFIDVANSSTPAGKVPSVTFDWLPSTYPATATNSAGKSYKAGVTGPETYGIYKVEAFYKGDATYAPSLTSTATVSVARRASQLSLADASSMIGRIFTTTATLKSDATPLATKAVRFTFEGRPFTRITNASGIAVATFTATLSTGAVQINAVFDGDDAYFDSNTATATVTVLMRPTYVTPLAATAIADKVFIASATLKDIDNLNVAGKTLSFVFDGNTVFSNTNALGVATAAFTANVSTGAYDIAVTFPGNFAYETSSTTLPLTVLRRPTSLVPLSNVSVYALDIFFATATLKDLDLLTLPAKPVRFVFQTSTFSRTTDGSGIFTSTWTAPAAAGVYHVNAYFDGDAKYEPSSVAITVTDLQRPAGIALNPVATTALDLFRTTATLTDLNNGSLQVSSRQVTFSFSWSASTAALTNSVGVSTADYTATATAGTYQLTGTFAGDATYASTTTIVPITVAKRNAFISGIYVSTRVLDAFPVTGTFNDSVSSLPVSGRTMKFILQQGATLYADTNVSGIATANFTAHAASGTYALYTYFDGDATYNPAALSISSVTLVRRDSNITLIGPSSVIINSTFTASGTMYDSVNSAGAGAGRQLSFLFQATTVPIATNGSGLAAAGYTVSPASGTYQLQVSFPGDATYNPSVSAKAVVALRYPTSLSASSITVTMNEIMTSTVTMSDYLSNTVQGKPLVFNFQGLPFISLTNSSGVAYSTYAASVASGTYMLPVSFPGDALYNSTNTSIPVLVNKRVPLLSLSTVTTRALDIFTSSATLLDARNPSQEIVGGKVTFEFDFATATFNNSGVTSVAGIAVSTFVAPLAAGTYEVRAYFGGNSTYYPSFTTSTVTVLARPARLELANASADIDELFRTTATLVDQATSLPVPGRTVLFTFGSSSAALTGVTGEALSEFTAPSISGAYQLDALFAGDDTYAADTATSTLTIKRRPAVLTATDISAIIDEVFTSTAVLADGHNAAPADARYIAFYFSGSTFTALTEAGGIAVSTFAAPSSSGTYYEDIVFAGDSRYLPQATTAQLTVTRRPSAIDPGEITARAAQIFTATASLRDILTPSYKPEGRALRFIFEGSTFTALTDASGVAVSTFMAPPSSSTVRIDIAYDGDARYEASSASSSITVLRRLSAITIDPAVIQTLNVLTATATLTDKADPGVFAPGRELTFSFTGMDFVSATDAGGIAVSTFAGPVSSGTYALEVSFAGDAIYEVSYASIAVTVIQRPAGITITNGTAYPFEEFTATGTLTDSALLTPVPGRTLTLELDGLQQTAVTDGAGVATSTYTPPVAFGDYELGADFAGDGTYAAYSGSGTITVEQRPTGIGTAGMLAIALDTFTVSASLTDVRFSTDIAGKEIAFSFEGQVSTATTDATGLAWTGFTAPVSSGVYNYTAQFAGDSVYAASSNSGAVAVDTRETKTIARDTNANVGEPFTLEAKLIDPAKEELPGYYVPNAAIKFTFKDRNDTKIDEGTAITNELGIATITFSGPGSPDVYYYTAKFEGNYTYTTSSATAMVKVGLLTSLVAFDVETIAMGNFTSKAKLTDYLSTTLDDKPVRFRFLGLESSGMTNADGSSSGIASSTFTAPASSGTYQYTAYFDGDLIYSASNATGTVKVTLRPSKILPLPASALAFSSFTAMVYLTDVASGENIGGRDVDMVFNGSTLTVISDPVSGLASAVFFAPVSSGTFGFSAYFHGDDTYEVSQSTVGRLTVQLRHTNMLSYNVSDLTANSTFTARVQIKDDYNQPIQGLSVDFNFESAFAIGETDAQGFAQVVLTAPASSGTYTFNAIFYGDLMYSSNTASGSVTVGPRPTLLFTPVASAKLGTPLGLSARLVDVASQAGIQGETISFYFGGSTLTAVTDASGVSSTTFPAPPSTGTFYYEADFQGNGFTYLGSYSSAPVTVALNLTTLSARDNISIKIYEPLPVEATLRDSDGLLLPGLPVTFTFEGTQLSGLTDSGGMSTAAFSTLGLPSSGTYNYSADYYGDTLYVASSDTSNVVNVSRRDSLLIARDAQAPPSKPFTAEARLYDNVNGSLYMGSPVVGRTIIFEFHDSTFTQTFSALTSDLGVSTVSFMSPVSTGTFLLTAHLEDADPVYTGALSSASVVVLQDDGTGAIKTKLKVDHVNAYINTVFTASGTLTASDLPVPGMTVLFEYFNGISSSTVLGYTNDVGIATVAFTAPASSGTYPITASFAGDLTYSAASGTETLTAARYPDTIVAQDISAYAGEVFTARAVLHDDLTLAYIAGKTLVFEFFDGVSTFTQTSITSSTGSAETMFTAPAVPGNYFYTASFAGDNQYVGATDTASLLIASRGSSTFLVGYDVYIGTAEVFTASATLTSKGYPVSGKPVTLTFQGVSRISTTNASGIALSTFTAPASSGTFVYDAAFAGDPLYNAAVSTAAVSVIIRKQVEQPVFQVAVTSATVTLAWKPVAVSSGVVSGYDIEESASLRGGDVLTSTSVVTSSASTMGYCLPVDENKTTFIKIKTKLDDNQVSQTSLIVEVPSKTQDPDRVPNYYYMSPGANPQDWAAWVRIPGKVMDKVGAAVFSVDVTKEANAGGFLAAYTITPNGASGDLAADLKASDRKGVKLTIAYPQSGTGTSASAGQLAIYWFNGVEWVKLGGDIDVLTGELYTYSRVMGLFAVKAAPLSSSFALTKVAPRIFTPDAPDATIGKTISRATFYFENPTNGEVTIRIFDVTGALVRRNLESASSSMMFWDGKDQSGITAKGGIYIYQIEAGDQVLTGTVVVAK